MALGAGVAVRLGLLTRTVPRRQHKLQREGWAHKGRGSSVDTQPPHPTPNSILRRKGDNANPSPTR